MISAVMIAIGVISIAATAMLNPNQLWANLLWNNFYFMAIALAALFFVAVQYVARAGWSAAIMRVPEAMMTYLWVAMPIMLIIVLVGGHNIYHWMHHDLVDPKSPEYDKIIAGKSAFLNMPFFMIRVVAYCVIWMGAAFLFRKYSLAEDTEGGASNYHKSTRVAIFFLILFAGTSSTMAWDFIMSIDSHWFSTLFGWYTFAGLFVSGMNMLGLLLVYLKRKGYMPEISEHHIHDVGKFMFAFSIFWTYLWFAQYMLIWYANLPEEVVYFITRLDHYRITLFAAFFLNFVIPFMVLMTRDAKRKMVILTIGGTIIFIGHWLDTFNMVVPGIMTQHNSQWQISWMEVGTTIGFLGLFLFWTLNMLSKAPLLRKNHPMMVESLHHSI